MEKKQCTPHSPELDTYYQMHIQNIPFYLGGGLTPMHRMHSLYCKHNEQIDEFSQCVNQFNVILCFEVREFYSLYMFISIFWFSCILSLRILETISLFNINDNVFK